MLTVTSVVQSLPLAQKKLDLKATAAERNFILDSATTFKFLERRKIPPGGHEDLIWGYVGLCSLHSLGNMGGF